MISLKKLISLLSIVLFVFFISLLIVNAVLFSSVAKTERVWIDSPLGEKVCGNLYYPKNPHPSRPIIIVFHGLSMESTVDLRPALELTKRGFYVLAVDQSGHGLTYGIQPGLQDDVLKPFFFTNIIGVVDYIYSRQDLFNISAIGCMGHSLGGWTTLMGTVLEPRINASVSWAGPTNISSLEIERSALFNNIGVTPENDFFRDPELMVNHSVVEYWNGTYGVNLPNNLLLIQGTHDTTVPYSQAIEGYNLVNDSSRCELVTIEGGDHVLLSDKVLNETIAWFETKLLGGVQGPLDYSQFTYFQFYVSYLLMLVSLLCTVFGVSFWAFKARDKYLTQAPEPTVDESLKEKTYRVAFLKLFIYSIPVLGIWVLLYVIQSFLYNYLVMLVLGAGFLLIYELILFYFQSRAKFTTEGIKTALKNQYNKNNLLIIILVAVFYVSIYYTLANGFKFLLFEPRSIPLYLLSMLAIFPFFLTHEIFQRKLIQDQFPRKRELHRWIFGIILFFFTFVSFFPLLYITFTTGAYLSVLVMVVFMVSVTLIDIYLYDKTRSVLATALFNTIVCAFFIAHIYFFYI